jgi:hypothetical protein
MLTTEFTSEEIEALSEGLDRQIRELDIEIDHTDTHDFKMKLRHHRDLLKSILQKIRAVPVGH